MQPRVSAFKPAGVPGRELEVVVLGLDEMEALRLADLEGLYHDPAARRMGISRATFGRLLEQARRKVVSALFDSRMLVFQGGPIVMSDTRVFACDECGGRFEVPFGTGRPAECPRCHGLRFHRAPENQARRGGRGARAGRDGGAGRGTCRSPAESPKE